MSHRQFRAVTAWLLDAGSTVPPRRAKMPFRHVDDE
jgi:hypothetical protein